MYRVTSVTSGEIFKSTIYQFALQFYSEFNSAPCRYSLDANLSLQNIFDLIVGKTSLTCARREHVVLYNTCMLLVSKKFFAFEGKNMKLFVYLIRTICKYKNYVASCHGWNIYPHPVSFGDAVAYVCLEMFLCFFQQFYRLAYVSRARFIRLFLDSLSILAPHDSNLR